MMDLRCSPFWRQMFAAMGMILHLMQYGLSNTFISVLLPQLRSSKYIVLDMEQESWIVSMSSFGVIPGLLFIPIIMDKFGRRTANLISISLMAASWCTMNAVSNYQFILTVRFFQGISSGMMMILAPVLLGEYTSPKYRGAFLSTAPLAVACGVLLLHTIGSFLNWWLVATVCCVVTLIDLVIVYLSPETPSFFAYHGRYEQCRAAFHWLRGLEEDAELEKMIKTNIVRKSAGSCSSLPKIQKKITNVLESITKKEVYKPLILVCHLLIINEWSASNILDVYTVDLFQEIVDKSVNLSAVIISTDVQRLVTNSIAIFVIRYVKRRVMVLRMISFNITMFLVIAAYVYARKCGILPFDHPMIGVILVHLHAFTMAMGNSPLAMVVMGEVFPLEYRSVCNMWGYIFYIVNVIINMKTVLILFATIGLEGAYCIYAGIVGYGLIVTMLLLPETKDKTLQEIEDEFRGAPLIQMTETVLLNGDKNN